MTICIYHGNCTDGFAAAWVVLRALGRDTEFHAGVYQDPPPDVTGKDVVMVDFSYKRPVIEEMLQKCHSLLVIDHHKTAQEDLEFLAPTWDNWMDHEQAPTHKGHKVFDMERSGAGLAWDFFNEGCERPPLINHIEDRDLWRFALPKTREIVAAVSSYPHDFVTWDWLMLECELDQLAIEGAAIDRKHRKDIDGLIDVVTSMMKIGGHAVPIANLPPTMASDAGALLCGPADVDTALELVKYPFAGCYWDTPSGRVFSLRSRDDGADVGEIAKQYGGGGHKHAAGFRVPFDQLDQFAP